MAAGEKARVRTSQGGIHCGVSAAFSRYTDTEYYICAAPHQTTPALGGSGVARLSRSASQTPSAMRTRPYSMSRRASRRDIHPRARLLSPTAHAHGGVSEHLPRPCVSLRAVVFRGSGASVFVNERENRWGFFSFFFGYSQCIAQLCVSSSLLQTGCSEFEWKNAEV